MKNAPKILKTKQDLIAEEMIDALIKELPKKAVEEKQD